MLLGLLALHVVQPDQFFFALCSLLVACSLQSSLVCLLLDRLSLTIFFVNVRPAVLSTHLPNLISDLTGPSLDADVPPRIEADRWQ